MNVHLDPKKHQINNNKLTAIKELLKSPKIDLRYMILLIGNSTATCNESNICGLPLMSIDSIN